MKYTIVIVKAGPTTYNAYSPDVPGCAAAGDDPEKLRGTFENLLRDYFRRTREAGGEPPLPTAVAYKVDLDVDDVA